ncbi:hypothetical protein BDF22DRAFT_701526 [Syncephalis plumigaleata]|nr:hypothetical protein BDF22DRAFT_701526 [Syncephalis plumigaleata]
MLQQLQATLVALRSLRQSVARNELASCCLILIAGLTEGPLALPFTTALDRALADMQCDLIMPVLSSSYLGYGTGLLGRDVEELDCLLERLYEDNPQLKVVLMGHSTGSQIVLRYARTGQYRTRILGGILQGAVSDRDYYTVHLSNLTESLALANELRATNRGHHWMPVHAYPDAPITADRFWSLLARGGEDDMFSVDLTREDLAPLYESVSIPLCMIQSGSDEYVPDTLQLETIMKRHHEVYPRYILMQLIDGAAHAPNDTISIDALIECIRQYLRQVLVTTTNIAN